jgi:thiamine pyrophosphate-dependent acetolactate synthase large subunit-like protein
VDRHAGDARALRGQPRHAWLRPDDQRGRALRRPDHRPHRGFLPGSRKAHIDIDPSSINKVIHADFPIIGDVGHVLEDMLRIWKARGRKTNSAAVQTWWQQIEDGARQLPRYTELRGPPSNRNTRWSGWRP